MSLNLHLLRTFDAVVKHSSFSRAGHELGVGQPAVSRAVREFEAQIGAPLLERGPSGIRPTEAGQVLVKQARVIFAAEKLAEKEVAAITGLCSGTLHVGASTTIATYFLPQLLSVFQKKYPGIDLRLTSANTLAIVEQLSNGQLDVALAEGPVDASTGICATCWLDDYLVMCISASHPLASIKTSIGLDHLADEIFITREPGSGTRDIVSLALSRAGLLPRNTMEVASNEVIAQLVAARVGLAVLSSAVIADMVASGRISVLQVRGLPFKRVLTRLTVPNQRLSPAAHAFNKLLDLHSTT
jgi:DNA-binding transcriptional LysR family regulator